MLRQYYKLPIKFADLYSKKEIVTCSLYESIAQKIFLIMTTKFGECRYNSTYGCELWDLDFQIMTSENSWKERIAKSVRKSIEANEQRLYDIKVQVEIVDEEMVNNSNTSFRIKKRLDIAINGQLTETRESFGFSQKLFLNPISID